MNGSNVITRIMRHEWMLLSREKVLLFALPLYVILIAYGLVNGVEWKQFLAKNTQEATAQADKGFSDKLTKLDRMLSGQDPYTFQEDPRAAGPLARYKGMEMATKPPAPPAALAIGQSDVLPSYLKVQWKPSFKQTNTDEIENPHNLAVGALDLSFVLIYLYPLLIIALSYNILSSERESGTQGLLLSQPVSVKQFVLGKILLRGAIIIGLAAAISVIGLLAASPEVFGSANLWRVAALAVLLLLYGVFWFGLSVLINAFGLKSSTNAMALMGVWIAVVLLIPAALNLYAKAAYPLPSRIEMVQALRRADKAAEIESDFQRSFRGDLLRSSEEQALEASSKDFYAKVLPLEERGEQLAAPVFDHFQSQRLSQQRVTEQLKYLSPPAIAQIALSELANQSSANFNAFTAQMEAYHRQWREYFYPAVRENRLLTRDEMVNIPRFQYVPESNGEVATRVLNDVLSLAVYACIALFLGFALLRRYPAAGR